MSGGKERERKEKGEGNRQNKGAREIRRVLNRIGLISPFLPLLGFAHHTGIDSSERSKRVEIEKERSEKSRIGYNKHFERNFNILPIKP